MHPDHSADVPDMAPAASSRTTITTQHRLLPRTGGTALAIALIGGLLTSAALGITTGPLSTLLDAAARSLAGTP